MDYWRRIEFKPEEWAGLKQHCESLHLDFIASPFSNAAVDLLTGIGVKKFKVGSGEVNNKLLLRCLSEVSEEIILSSGMSSLAELDDAIHFLKTSSVRLYLLQCTSSYPTVPGQWGLNLINDFKERYQIPVGFSDHSGDIFACLSAASRGARLLEFHVVFDKRMFGPDTSSSITIDQAKTLVHGARQIAFDLQKPIHKNETGAFDDLKRIFGKSLAVNKNLPSGHRLTFNDLEAKKPSGRGICPTQYEKVLGRQINRDMEQWIFFDENDLL
jgi:N-acetylneuraminate synthase